MGCWSLLKYNCWLSYCTFDICMTAVLNECNIKAFVLILVFFVHIFVLSSYNCRVWPVWGVLKNALLFLQTTMDPFLVFLLVPLGSLEFRLAGVIVFLTLHDNQIYFEHLKKIMPHSALLFLLPCIPLRWARQGFTGHMSAASTGAVTMAPIRWCWLEALKMKWWVL